MKENTFKSFDKGLSWNTKLYFLLTLLLVVSSYMYELNSAAFTVAAVVSIALVVLIDYFKIFSVRSPRTWQTIKWLIMLIIILLTLVSYNGL